MENKTAIPVAHTILATVPNDTNACGVAWGAVFAGGTAAAALSLILLILGLGLGLSTVSPWSYSAAAVGGSTIAWITFTQLAASGVGGYLAGRLRVRWASLHTDEVYFRDTAHGLLTWSLASLFTAALLAGVIRVILGGAIDAGAGAAATAAPTAVASAMVSNGKDEPGGIGNPIDYFTDMLLRADPTTAAPDTGGVTNRGEVSKILFTDIGAGKLTVEDRTYLASLVSKRSGLNQADAEHRVDDIYGRVSKAIADAKESAKQAADTARKTAAHTALWMFIALLLGAFVASLAATMGGRQRDDMQLHNRH